MSLLIPILIILLGLALVMVEVYLVPGFNIIGIAGVLLIIFSIGYTFTERGFSGGVMVLVGTLVVGGGVFYLMWTSGAWERFVLATNLRSDDLLAQRESEDRARYLGKSGVALTPLRPTGVAEIEGERIEVVTEGDFIAAGSKVRVVAMDRRRYFVRLAGQVSQTSSSATV